MGQKILIIVMSITMLIGCASRVPQMDTFQAQGMKVGQITIRVADGALDDRREQVFTKAEGAKLLRDDLTGLLTAQGLFDESSTIALDVEVTSFRMRNGATRYFTGVFSGADHLAGEMNVAQGGKTIFKKPLRVSGGNGNPFNISSVSRSEGLTNSFAKLVVHALRNDPLVPPVNAPVQAVPPTKAVAAVTIPKARAVGNKTQASDSCSVDQVLSMKQSGLSDSQIRAACKMP